MNFHEVSPGLTDTEAVNEAERCLNCKNPPCVKGCPVGVNIPEFISKIKQNDVDGAYKIITETNALPAVCGRVCPQELQCEKLCVRSKKGESVTVGKLERYCADYCAEMRPLPIKKTSENGIKIAVAGAGPAGLTCAGELALNGYEVDIYEAFHEPGGVLVYGIPEFRLPKSIVKREIDNLKTLGVNIYTNMVIGRILTVDELFEMGYKAVFIGTGAGTPGFMGIEGETANGVLSANEYLTRINLMRAYDSEYDTPIPKSRNVAVIGGGNVAMDAARCALRLGAENVYVLYRRTETEMPARAEEIRHAKEEGIVFRMLTVPVKINTDNDRNAVSIDCILMQLGEPDENGRRIPYPIQNSGVNIEADTVIMAIGTSPNPVIHQTTNGLETDKRGCILVRKDEVTTSRPGVFAGGDAVTGAATVISAMGAGKKAAHKIMQYVEKI